MGKIDRLIREVKAHKGRRPLGAYMAFVYDIGGQYAISCSIGRDDGKGKLLHVRGVSTVCSTIDEALKEVERLAAQYPCRAGLSVIVDEVSL